jgi:hypothetical protein
MRQQIHHVAAYSNPFEGPAVERMVSGQVVKSVYLWNGIRLGQHEGPPPASPPVMERILREFREADPVAHARMVAEHAEVEALPRPI